MHKLPNACKCGAPCTERWPSSAKNDRARYACGGGAYIERGGETLASLGGIVDPSSSYRRVIEAELAMEAIETIASLQAPILDRATFAGPVGAL